MFLSGLLEVANSTEKLITCHFGSFEGGVEVILPTKFYSTNVPLYKVISYCGAMQRKDGKLSFEVKDFLVICDFVDDFVLSNYITCHGEMCAMNTIKSQSWHGKDLGMYGDFMVKVHLKEKDKVMLN